MDLDCLGEEMTELTERVHDVSSKGQEESRMIPELD